MQNCKILHKNARLDYNSLTLSMTCQKKDNASNQKLSRLLSELILTCFYSYSLPLRTETIFNTQSSQTHVFVPTFFFLPSVNTLTAPRTHTNPICLRLKQTKTGRGNEFWRTTEVRTTQNINTRASGTYTCALLTCTHHPAFLNRLRSESERPVGWAPVPKRQKRLKKYNTQVLTRTQNGRPLVHPALAKRQRAFTALCSTDAPQ